MGILDKIRRRYRNAATVTAEDSRFSAWLAGKGYVLGPEKALQVAAVFRCVDIITKTMGTLPIHLMKRVGEGGRERAENHPVYPLVYILPNPPRSERVYPGIMECAYGQCGRTVHQQCDRRKIHCGQR